MKKAASKHSKARCQEKGDGHPGEEKLIMTDLCRNKPLKKIKIKIESYYYFPVFPCHQYQSVLQALEQINHILLIKKKKKLGFLVCWSTSY